MLYNYKDLAPLPESSIRTVSGEAGFVFSVSALGVSLIMGFFVLWSLNSASLKTSMAGDRASVSQSSYSALSGVVFSEHWAEVNGLEGLAGIWDFMGTNIVISVETEDRFGNPLSSDQARLVSTVQTQDNARRYEALLQLTPGNFWPSLSRITDVDKEFKFKDNAIFNGSVYMEDKVKIECDNCVGTTGTAQFYFSEGEEIDDRGSGNNWEVVDIGELTLPATDFTLEDSLIDIALAINETAGNKIKDDYKLELITLDLTVYENNTLFVEHNIEFEGCTITGCTVDEPCFIVAGNEIKLKEKDGQGTVVGDNVIGISRKKLTLEKWTQFGVDSSSVQPGMRPVTVNELYAQDDEIYIKDDVEWVWAQVISPTDKIKVNCPVYGLLYTGHELEFDDNNSAFEGRMFIRRWKKPSDEQKKGTVNLVNWSQMRFGEIMNYELVSGSRIEF